MPRMKEDELREVIEKRVAHLGMQIEGNAKWKIINLSKGVCTENSIRRRRSKRSA